MTRAWALLTSVGLIVALPAVAGAIELSRDVLGAVDGSGASASYQLRATVGLPVAGRSTGQNHDLWAGFWFPEATSTTGIGPHAGPVLPVVTRLYQNAPNPFNPTTVIRFDVARSGATGGDAGVATRLAIYDVNGRNVTTLLDESLAPGAYEVRWDGGDSRGARVASGIYFARLVSGLDSKLIRMVVAK